MDAREQHIARIEGRQYTPTYNQDAVPTAFNGSEIDDFYLQSFDDWVRANQINVNRLFGLLRSRK